MALIIIGFLLFAVCKAISDSSARNRERKRAAEIEQQRRDNARIREEWRQRQAEAKLETARLIAVEREAMRLAKEQEKQAAQLAKHEEQLAKLEQRLSVAESEIAFNREQRDRLFLLLDIEERERAACIEGSATWQKHHKKIITLENQIHTVQKRLDKAQMDKAYCNSKLSA